MAVDTYDATTGRPVFIDGGAPDVGGDPTAVGIYAADVGNRIVRANKAALDAYQYKRAGLRGHALDKRCEYVYTGSTWAVVPYTLGFAFVEPAGEQIMGTALTTVAGLSITGMPTGTPLLLEVNVQVANGQWASTRRVDVQAMNGSTAVGPARKFGLPAKSDETVGTSITHLVKVDAPTADTWTLKLGCDLASAVAFWQASLRLSHRV